jgi:AraC-like DNA-binding protein
MFAGNNQSFTTNNRSNLMNRLIFILCISILLPAHRVVAQQPSSAEKADSIVAVLPRLSGEERLDALKTLGNLYDGLPEGIHFIKMIIEEARRQGNVEAEGKALKNLVYEYYLQFDTDSIFIAGEEAVRFTRQHKMYDDLFSVQCELIRRHSAQGKMLTAMRKAEEAYAEAKALQQNMSMAMLLAVMAELYLRMEQYEEVVSRCLESIELATPHYREENHFFIFDLYYDLAFASKNLNRPHEMLRYADSMHVELDRWQRDGLEYNMQRCYFYTENFRALAYAEMNQPRQALEAIRRAEAVYDPRWDEASPFARVLLNTMYAAYYQTIGDHEKALEYYSVNLLVNEASGLPSSILTTKKRIADVNFEKGDHTAAAETYRRVIQVKDSLNAKQFFAQINELRTLYELDKAELEAERHLSALQRHRMYIAGLLLTCLAMTLIVGLVVWSRRKIARKNRGLYLQIKEQDHLKEENEQWRQRYGTLTQPTLLQPAGSSITDGSTTAQVNDWKQHDLVSRFHDYLLCENNYAKPETRLDEIIAALATNRSYFFDALKAVTRKTPVEYIHAMRLEEAKRMLETNLDLNIEVIAEQCGFNSRTTFYRLFRERYQINPSQYRKLAGKQAATK